MLPEARRVFEQASGFGWRKASPGRANGEGVSDFVRPPGERYHGTAPEACSLCSPPPGPLATFVAPSGRGIGHVRFMGGGDAFI